MTVSPQRVLYTDPAWLIEDGQIRPELATVERKILDGTDLRFGPHDGGRYALDGPEFLERADGCAVLVVYRCQVTPALLDAAGPRLRGVIRQGVGLDNLNAPLLNDRGLPGYSVPDYCVAEVATHTAAMALALERQLIPQHQTLVGGRFDIYAGGVPRRLSSRTLGIVGFGRIGRAVARQLGTFYDRVLVHDPYQGGDLAEGYGAHAVGSLTELLERSDMVTLHCPLSAETELLINAETLPAMRRDAYLVNAARGRLVDPVALGDVLDAGDIAGAALDVFAPENPHDDPRWARVLAHPRVVVTSHRAFLSEQAETSSRRRVATTARALLNGESVTVGRVEATGDQPC